MSSNPATDAICNVEYQRNKSITAGAGTKTAALDIEAEATPQPQAAASLGMLALGADALTLWRCEEESHLSPNKDR